MKRIICLMLCISLSLGLSLGCAITSDNSQSESVKETISKSEQETIIESESQSEWESISEGQSQSEKESESQSGQNQEDPQNPKGIFSLQQAFDIGILTHEDLLSIAYHSGNRTFHFFDNRSCISNHRYYQPRSYI